MSSINESGTFKLGDRIVKRLGYGVMQLAGPGVFGPPKDHDAALAVLREAVASGVNHIDTADFYGPHVTNQIIREALAPYRDDLVIVTKIGATRGEDGSWNSAFSREQLTQAVHDNLRVPFDGLIRWCRHHPMRTRVASGHDALHMRHELRQVFEVAPELIHRVSRPIDRHAFGHVQHGNSLENWL